MRREIEFEKKWLSIFPAAADWRDAEERAMEEKRAAGRMRILLIRLIRRVEIHFIQFIISFLTFSLLKN